MTTTSSATRYAPVRALLKGDVPLWRSGTLLGLAALMFLAFWINPPSNLSPQSGVVMRLPGEVGDFIGLDSPVSQAELTILPKDTEFVRKDYQDYKGNEILCSIILSGAEQRSIHRPEVCLVAQGWNIVGQQNLPIPLASGHRLVVRNLSIQRDVVARDGSRHIVRAFYMYWFIGEDIATPSHFTRVFISAWDRIIHNRAHRWAYVIAMSPITASFQPGGKDDAQTREMLARFVHDAVVTFQKTEIPPGS